MYAYIVARYLTNSELMRLATHVMTRECARMRTHSTTMYMN